MVKFSYREQKGTIDYEFQSSTESYIRIDGEKNHKLRFIGLERVVYEQFTQELIDLGVLDWKYKINVDDLDNDSWSLLLCGVDSNLFIESDVFEKDYKKLFRIIKKYDLD